MLDPCASLNWSVKESDYVIETLITADEASLVIFWLKGENLRESDNLPNPDVLAQEIGEDLEAALEQFREIATDLGADLPTEGKIIRLEDLRKSRIALVAAVYLLQLLFICRNCMKRRQFNTGVKMDPA